MCVTSVDCAGPYVGSGADDWVVDCRWSSHSLEQEGAGQTGVFIQYPTGAVANQLLERPTSTTPGGMSLNNKNKIELLLLLCHRRDMLQVRDASTNDVSATCLPLSNSIDALHS